MNPVLVTLSCATDEPEDNASEPGNLACSDMGVLGWRPCSGTGGGAPREYVPRSFIAELLVDICVALRDISSSDCDPALGD